MCVYNYYIKMTDNIYYFEEFYITQYYDYIHVYKQFYDLLKKNVMVIINGG